MPSKTLPLALVVSVSSGSDPDVIEIEDCVNVYGDSLDLFPMVERWCESPNAPAGQCEFNAVALEHDRCLYCGKRTG